MNPGVKRPLITFLSLENKLVKMRVGFNSH